MRKSNNILVAFVVVGLITMLGMTISQQAVARRTATESSAAETTIVQRGDMSIIVEASGSLVSPTELSLAFPVTGRIYEITVAEGDIVQEGDLLARLEGNIQAEAEFQALFSDAGITQSELALINARDALGYAIDDLAYLIGLDAYYWEKQLSQAEENLAILNQNVNTTVDQKTVAEEQVETARGWRDYFQELRIKKLESVKYRVYDVPKKPPGGKPPQSTGQTPPTRAYHILYVRVTESDLSLVYANWENAKVALEDAQATLEIVKAGASFLQTPLIALGPEMARLEQTRLNLENTRLLTSINGVATAVNFQVGEYVAPGVPVIVVNNLVDLEAVVKLDETDISRIQVGMPVIVTVDAFPGQNLVGRVTGITPTANVQSGVVLYPVTIHLDATDLPLRSGMTVRVTFPIEKRTDILLVPFRAVETQGGQAYLTRVTGLGNERVAVTLGLITDSQVEILSCIEAGDVVTVYANPVQDAEVMSNPMFGGGH